MTKEERRRESRRDYYERNKERYRQYSRNYYVKHKEETALYNRRYVERLKRGEIQLPPLDWAICARGGSAAQAQAHYRRGEKPCDACRRAANADLRDRKARKKEQVAA